MSNSNDCLPAISDRELDTIVGGNRLTDTIKNGVRDGYRGAVNWGVGAYAGTQAAKQLYEGHASWGAWWAQVKAFHGALDATGKLPEAVPFSSYY